LRPSSRRRRRTALGSRHSIRRRPASASLGLAILQLDMRPERATGDTLVRQADWPPARVFGPERLQCVRPWPRSILPCPKRRRTPVGSASAEGAERFDRWWDRLGRPLRHCAAESGSGAAVAGGAPRDHRETRAVKVLLEKFLENQELVAACCKRRGWRSSIWSGTSWTSPTMDTSDGRAFVVMEFLDGEALASW